MCCKFNVLFLEYLYKINGSLEKGRQLELASSIFSADSASEAFVNLKCYIRFHKMATDRGCYVFFLGEEFYVATASERFTSLEAETI